MTETKKRRPHVLVVDDDPLIELLTEYLRKEHDVSVATNGEQALDFCRQRLPDLVLLDVIMPDLDGYEVCRMLKMNTATRDVPIIFLTVRDGLEDEVNALEMGAVDFISKPAHPSIVLARVRTHLALKQQSEQLWGMAMTDAVTGIANRRFIDKWLETEWRRCRRSQRPISVIMIDIDHFKLYNDTYGHQAGDECLRQVASALKGIVRRAGDALGRYGGEEFICVMPETAFERAVERADELGRAVERLNIIHGGPMASPLVTISRGVSTSTPSGETELTDLLAVADAMLYEAKCSGRNCTRSCMLGQTPTPEAARQHLTGPSASE